MLKQILNEKINYFSAGKKSIHKGVYIQMSKEVTEIVMDATKIAKKEICGKSLTN
jgi:hypothetical protein